MANKKSSVSKAIKKSCSYTLGSDVVKELKLFCAGNDIKQNAVVEEALREYFDKRNNRTRGVVNDIS